MIIGDFNLPNIDWERGVATGPGKELLEAVEDKLMSQLVEFSTQLKGNILDLVLTNMPERISEVRETGRESKSSDLEPVKDFYNASSVKYCFCISSSVAIFH